MKKVIMVIVAIMMVIICASASYAEDGWNTVMVNIRDCLENDGILDKYNDTVDDWGIYGTYCGLSTENLKEEFGVDLSKVQNFEKWFSEWYESELKEQCPQYGDLSVVVTKYKKYNGTQIYHLTIAAMNDLVEYVEGDQAIVDMMFGLY